MADSFFGFDSTLPGNGVGRSDMLQNDLATAAEDNEIDMLNDETFGAGAEAGDWEEGHEKLAQELEVFQEGLQPSMDDQLHYEMQEDDLEHTIRKLVVDDDEIDDPAVMNVSKQRPIPGRKDVNLDNLFGPSSPPGFLNTEHLVSPGKSNIWGSPVSSSKAPAQPEEGISNLLYMLQNQPSAPPRNVPLPHDPSIVTAGKPMSSSLPNAKNLKELEQEMMGSGQRPRAFTVEELERQMRGGQPPPPGIIFRHRRGSSPSELGLQAPIGTPPRGMPMGTPPRGNFMHQTPQPRVPMVQAGANRKSPIDMLLGTTPPPGTPGIIHRASPPTNQAGIRSPSPPVAALLCSASLSPVLLCSPSPPPMPTHTVAPPSITARMTHSPPLFQNKLMSSPLARELLSQMLASHQSGGLHGSPMARPNGRDGPHDMPPFLSNTPVQQRLPLHHLGYSDPREMRGHRGGPPRPPFNNRGKFFGPGPPQGFNHEDRPPFHHGDGHNQGFNHDGSMTRDRGFNYDGSFYREGFHRDGSYNHDGYNNREGGYRDGHDFRGRGRGDYFRGRDDFWNRDDFRGRGDDFRGRGDDFRGRGDDFRGRDDVRLRGDDFRGRGDDFRERADDFRGRGEDFRGRDDFRGRGRGDMRRGRGRSGYPGPRPWHHYQHYEEDNNAAGDRDIYSGLMTQREKDWIIKIQLMQLHTENPYLDDFYYTTWMMNKLAQERLKEKQKGQKGDDGEPTLVLPQLAQVENRSYRPMQFEGSLGRLTASSVHNPRQILDVRMDTRTGDEDSKGREVRRYKQQLIEIEKSFDFLLEIDDTEKKALALPDNARPQMFKERRLKINDLYSRLHCESNIDGKFLSMISVRKGIKLTSRTIPLLDLDQSSRVVCAVLRNLAAFLKKEIQEEVLEQLYCPVASVISSSALGNLVEFADELRQGSQPTLNSTNSIVTALQNKFGASLIWCLVSRGEVIYVTESPVDLEIDHQQAWSEFISWLAQTLDLVSKNQLALPQRPMKNVAPHLERLLDKKTFVSLEDKLETITCAVGGARQS